MGKNRARTYDCEYDEPLEQEPPDEPHGCPPERVGAVQDEQRAGQLRHPLLAGHRRAAPARRHLGAGVAAATLLDHDGGDAAVVGGPFRPRPWPSQPLPLPLPPPAHPPASPSSPPPPQHRRSTGGRAGGQLRRRRMERGVESIAANTERTNEAAAANSSPPTPCLLASSGRSVGRSVGRTASSSGSHHRLAGGILVLSLAAFSDTTTTTHWVVYTSYALRRPCTLLQPTIYILRVDSSYCIDGEDAVTDRPNWRRQLGTCQTVDLHDFLLPSSPFRFLDQNGTLSPSPRRSYFLPVRPAAGRWPGVISHHGCALDGPCAEAEEAASERRNIDVRSVRSRIDEDRDIERERKSAIELYKRKAGRKCLRRR